MIINNLSMPYKSLYVVGAEILSILRTGTASSSDPLELFVEFKASNSKVSLAYFVFALDWLYMIGSVELLETGDVKLCS